MRLTSRNGQEMERMHRSNSNDATETEKRRRTAGDGRGKLAWQAQQVKGLQNGSNRNACRGLDSPRNGGSSLPEAFDRKSRSLARGKISTLIFRSSLPSPPPLCVCLYFGHSIYTLFQCARLIWQTLSMRHKSSGEIRDTNASD